MKITALIMAGGQGERFWPRSRKNLPKQFLAITNEQQTMIQLTVKRILSLVNIDDVFISTRAEYRELVAEQLPDIPVKNIICEPFGRNTAPCIGLAAIHMLQKYDDAVMLVLPSDHLVKYNEMFISNLEDAVLTTTSINCISTLGIMPTYPETGYGYIKFGEKLDEYGAYNVEKFVEKPSSELAKVYCDSETYLWNSGIFIWKISSIIEAFKKYMPQLYQGLIDIRKSLDTENEDSVLQKVFYCLDSVSIDYGILEKYDNICVIPSSFGWDDLGSWLALSRIKKLDELNNSITGNVITINTKNCIIESTSKLIATVGLENLIIIDTDDAMLICNKESSMDVKKVLDNLKICNRVEYI